MTLRLEMKPREAFATRKYYTCACGLNRPTDETEKENMKHINTKEHQKLVEARYNANPKFWDNVYKKQSKKPK